MAGDKGYYRFPSDFRYFIGFIGFTQKKKIDNFFCISVLCSYEKKLMAKQRQTLWLKTIKREDILSDNIIRLNLLKYGKVCAKHFVAGKLAGQNDHRHTDWLPSLNMGNLKSVRSPQEVQRNVE
jgi:hypothetical protein